MSGADAVRGSRAVVGLVAGLAAMTILDLSKISVALPSIGSALGAGPLDLQLVLAAYVFAYAVALIPGGLLGDGAGRRRMTLIALTGALIASIGCAASPDAATLIVFRVIQGISAGLLMPQLLGTLHTRLAGPARARAFGVYGATISSSLALGPVIGGALIVAGGTHDGWRWIFLMNVPLIVAAIVAVRVILPPEPPTGRPVSIDGVGLALFSIGLVLILAPIVTTTGGATDSPARWWALVPAALALVAFALHQRRRERAGRPALVDPALVRIPTFRNGLLVAGTWFAGNLGLVIVVMLYLQVAHGLNPFAAGLVNVPFSIASAASAFVGGRLVSRVGRPLVAIGIVIALVGIALSITVVLVAPASAAVALLASTQFLTGLGAGLVVSPNQALSLAQVPNGRGSAAGSLTQLSQRIGNSLGAASVAAAFFAVLAGAGQSLGAATPGQAALATAAGLLVCAAFIVASLVAALGDVADRRRTERRASAARPPSPLPDPAPSVKGRS